MNPKQVTADLAQPQDADAILELNVQEYGPSDILTTRTDFAWRHDQNPAGRAVVPVIRASHGHVVGFIWLVPLRLRMSGRDRLAAAGTNLVIHPEYRNTFGYTKLIRRLDQACQDQHIPLHWSFVSEANYGRLGRQSPRTVATIPLLLKLLGPISARRQPRQQEIVVQAAHPSDACLDQFWSLVQDKYPVMVIRDRAFLAWRFAELAQRRYRLLIARAGDQMLGYVVVRCATIRGIKTGLVMDLLITQDARGQAAAACLIEAVEAYFRTQGMWLAAGLMVPHAAEFGALRQAGYICWPSALAPHAFRFAFIIHNRHEPDLAALSAQDWFVTLADYESF